MFLKGHYGMKKEKEKGTMKCLYVGDVYSMLCHESIPNTSIHHICYTYIYMIKRMSA